MKLLEKIESWFTEAQWSGLKEIGRWLVFLVVSDIISQLLNQVHVLPEYYILFVWKFVYTIPLRTGFKMALTLLLRYIDKVKHQSGKLRDPEASKPMGILPF